MICASFFSIVDVRCMKCFPTYLESKMKHYRNNGACVVGIESSGGSHMFFIGVDKPVLNLAVTCVVRVKCFSFFEKVYQERLQQVNFRNNNDS